MDAHIILPPAPSPSPHPHRPSAHTPLDHPLRPLLTLPPGTTRIIILSNIRRHFPLHQIGITAGDFIIHLNHAIHAPKTLPIPGTHHALILRHNTKTGPKLHWFSSPSLDGFEQILPIKDHQILPHCSWFRAFRSISSKSPTTGFIAANLCRELFPRTPLLLAGFDPAHDHGTPRWEGHDWQTEADWYHSRYFPILPPTTNPPHLHQIWIGPPPPKKETTWIHSLAAAAQSAGWQHTLWDWPSLLQTFCNDPATPLLARAIQTLPSPKTYTLASDYYRLRLLAHLPGLYLDTDFSLTSHSFPSLPAGHTIGLISERYNTSLPASAFLLSLSSAPFALASSLACRRLSSLLSNNFSENLQLITANKSLISTLGPHFLRHTILPAFRRLSFPYTILPPSLIGHSTWSPPSPLSHHSTSHWLKIC